MDASRRHPPLAHGADADRRAFWGTLRDIKSTAGECSCIGVALDAYFQEITRPGLVAVKRGRERQASPAQYTFITDLVRNLILFGWSAWREIVPEDDNTEVMYQVPDGSEVAIRFDPKLKKWVADKRIRSIMDDSDIFDSEGEEFYELVILQPPTESQPVSFGQRALSEAKRLLHFEKCQKDREFHNSRRECYVHVDNNAISTTSSGTPWLQSSIPSGSALGSNDYETLVQHRVEMLRALSQTTAVRRHEAGPMGRVGAGLPTPDNRLQQHEYPITDGHRPIEARHMLGPSNENDLLRMLMYRVWEAMGVPPSALGHVPNKERASGAERATGSALDGFRTISAHIANVIRPAMQAAKLQLGRRVRVEVFKEVFPLLKPDAAVTLLEAVFDVPRDMFDSEAVAEMQKTQRLGNSKQQSDDDDRGSKKQKSQLEQDVTVAKKAGL
jgi:hypothetical protein